MSFLILILAHDGHKQQGMVSYPAEKYSTSLNSGAWAAWDGNVAGRAKFAGLTVYSGDSWGEENLNAVKRSTSQWVRTAQRPHRLASRQIPCDVGLEHDLLCHFLIGNRSPSGRGTGNDCELGHPCGPRKNRRPVPGWNVRNRVYRAADKLCIEKRLGGQCARLRKCHCRNCLRWDILRPDRRQSVRVVYRAEERTPACRIGNSHSARHPERMGNCSSGRARIEEPLLRHVYRGNERQPDARSFSAARRIDRSPCGTGNSARLALRHGRGQARVGDTYPAFSIIGGRFDVHIAGVTKIANRPAVLPSVLAPLNIR